MRPNVLVILPDQWRLMALGLWRQPGWALPGGGDAVDTPHLDRLAQESLVLTRAVSNFPLCSPYRAMFLSGRFPHANRVTGNCNSTNAPHGVELPIDLPCWSDVLAAHGWRTGYIGKWHLDAPHPPYVDTANNRGPVAWNEWCPPERRHGFRDWYAYGTYDRHLRPHYWSTDMRREEIRHVDQWGPEHEADRAIAFLRAHRGPDPFALVVAMNPPHTDYGEVPERLLARVRGRDLLTRPNVDHATLDRPKAQREAEAYAAMVEGVDEQVGRILACLDETGLARDTLVLFTADHGCCLHSHREGFKNVPWDESLLVPFLLRFPGRVASRCDDRMVLSVPDLMPTLLALLGLRAAIPDGVQGRDLADAVRGADAEVPDAALYQRIPVDDPAGGWRGLRTREHLLVVRPERPEPQRVELFALRDDPWQLRDRAADEPATVAALRARLAVELRRAQDPWLARHG